MSWFSLPDQGIEVRKTEEGAFWRHDPPGAHDTEEGVGPYGSLEEAAKDGADYAQFVSGTGGAA